MAQPPDLVSYVMLSELETLLAPLGRLDEGTRGAILLLIGAAELVAATGTSATEAYDGVGERFEQVLARLHSPGAGMVADLRERKTESPAGSALDSLMDVLKSLGLPAPLARERRCFVSLSQAVSA